MQHSHDQQILTPASQPASDTDHLTSATSFDPLMDLAELLLALWQHISDKIKHYAMASDGILDEILLMGSQQQLNDALNQFVVNNVDMVKELRLELHDNWLRLYATVYTSGVFASVACNFRLVSIELNGDYQRLIFEQLSNTDILSLHSKKWYIAFGAKIGVFFYRLLLKKDPLPLALQKITVKGEPFAVHKGKYIYLDISRYFANNPKIISYFKKAQVNYAYTEAGHLLAKVQIHVGELLSFSNGNDDIISDQDNPNAEENSGNKNSTSKGSAEKNH